MFFNFILIGSVSISLKNVTIGQCSFIHRRVKKKKLKKSHETRFLHARNTVYVLTLP